MLVTGNVPSSDGWTAAAKTAKPVPPPIPDGSYRSVTSVESGAPSEVSSSFASPPRAVLARGDRGRCIDDVHAAAGEVRKAPRQTLQERV